MNLNYEQIYFQKNYTIVTGTDEVGRGPLAGPVVAACVSLDKNKITTIPKELFEIKDSKKLSEKKRDYFFEKIKTQFSYGIGQCDHKTIDKINILQASFLAMKIAIEKSTAKPEIILVDGSQKIPNLGILQESIPKGDTKIFCIAAASIIAKVTRDKIMTEYHKKYPEYNFAKHKGYGTKEHLVAIKKHGPCPIHRLSFAPFKNK